MANNMTTEELEKAYLSDSSASEFDSCVAMFRRRQRVRWTVSCAASLVILCTLGLTVNHFDSQHASNDITTVELIETISVLTESNIDEIKSINAKSGKNGITVTAEFKNGITRTYIMKRGADGSTIEMTAQNSK